MTTIDATKTITATDQALKRDQALRKACKDFESVFSYELLKSMRATVDKSGLFDGGQGEEIYQSLLDQELAKNMAGSGANSLAEVLYRQLSRIDAGTTEGHVDTNGTQSVVSSIEGLHGGTDVQTTEGEDDDTEQAISAAAAQEVNETDLLASTDTEPQWPVSSIISSGFGWRKDPFTAKNRFHNGIDIAAAEGTEVKAAMSGKVVMSCTLKGYGNVVAVHHGEGLVTIYAHNEENTVKVGDQVEKGAVLARVGSTGRSTGPHLHFEVRKDGVKTDPLEFLSVA